MDAALERGSAWRAHMLTDPPPTLPPLSDRISGRLNGDLGDLTACLSARIRFLLDCDYSKTRLRDWTIREPDRRPMSRSDVSAAFGRLRHHLYRCVVLRKDFVAHPSTAAARSIADHWRESRALTRLILDSFIGMAFKVSGEVCPSPGLASEYCQEAMIGLARAVDYHNPQLGWAFTTFAWRSVRHHLMEYRRRMALRYSPNVGTDLPEIIDRSPAPSLSAEVAELQAALARIPRVQADVIRRRFGIGCAAQTLASAGQSMGLSKEAVRHRQVKAMRSLRFAMGIKLSDLQT